MMTTKRLAFIPTFRCSLNCKLCNNHIPEFRKIGFPPDPSTDDIKKEIDAVFSLFDKIDWIQFVGGEIFMRNDIGELVKYCNNYRDQFDIIVIETNGTILPDDYFFDALAEYGQDSKVMFSDYGELSRKLPEFVAKLEERDLPYVLKKYHDDDQHFGGWIDNTACKDLGETEEEIATKTANCTSVLMENMFVWDGCLYRCSNSLALYKLGLFEPNPRDHLDMFDNSLSLEEKRNVIRDFYKTPRKSCRYCTWKDTRTLERFKAAEQA